MFDAILIDKTDAGQTVAVQQLDDSALPEGEVTIRSSGRPSAVAMVALKSWMLTGLSRTSRPSASVLPYARPPRMPPPASRQLKALG